MKCKQLVEYHIIVLILTGTLRVAASKTPQRRIRAKKERPSTITKSQKKAYGIVWTDSKHRDVH